MLESVPKFWTKPPEPETSSPVFSNRVVALSPGSKALLTRLGIWDDIWRNQPVCSLQVWDALSDANITFNYPDYSTPVSYIVENPVLAYAVCQSLDKLENVQVKFESRVRSCTLPDVGNDIAKATVALESGAVLKTDLLVEITIYFNYSIDYSIVLIIIFVYFPQIGADGFNSKVRQAISGPAVTFNYDRTAVVATLKLSEAAENRSAWQRFLPTGGPIALLPVMRK